MPQRLHRLDVRKWLIADLSFPQNQIVSREAGNIDVFVPRNDYYDRDEASALVVDAVARRGVRAEIMSVARQRRYWRVRITNALMEQQRDWGARGNSAYDRAIRGESSDGIGIVALGSSELRAAIMASATTAASAQTLMTIHGNGEIDEEDAGLTPVSFVGELEPSEVG